MWAGRSLVVVVMLVAGGETRVHCCQLLPPIYHVCPGASRGVCAVESLGLRFSVWAPSSQGLGINQRPVASEPRLPSMVVCSQGIRGHRDCLAGGSMAGVRTGPGACLQLRAGPRLIGPLQGSLLS